MAAFLRNVTLVVQDPERSRAFYGSVLDLPDAREAGPGFVMLQAGEVTLILQPAAASSAAPQPGGVELGFEVADVDAVRAALLAAGGTVGGLQRMGWGEALDARDPDGHALTLYCRR